MVGAAATSSAYGYEFTTGINDLTGSWVSNVTTGVGIRTQSPGAADDVDAWGNGNAGDLNYHKGQPFSAYISATSELLLLMPSEGLKFMVRGTGMYDFAAGHTDTTSLTSSASAQVVYNAQLLDLWVEKDFTVGGNAAHVRLGNQVINWGESIYAMGGINATNSLDIQKLLIPGTQLKQALLPAPMLSFAADLSHGFSTEDYYQFQWNGNRYPPVGSYWSVSNNLGRGMEPYLLNTENYNVAGTSADSVGLPFSWQAPSKYKPQFGIKFNYTPRSFDANFAFYYENYTDKSPVLSSLANGTERWSYLENRQLFGTSANFGVGDWAIGTELSYRPRDAVSLSSCYGAGGALDANTNSVSGIDCQQWVDEKRFQYDINGILALTPSEYPFLKLIRADAATLTWELTWIYYPGLNASGITRMVDGEEVTQVPQAGYLTWLNYASGSGYPIASAKGTPSSVGATIDFNWTYDGSLIRGWQVTPGMTFSDGLYGYTPTLTANYLQGAKSINFYVLFNQNPTVWQAGINYTMFWGGHDLVGQPYADRNFVGMFVTRNF